MARPPVIRTRRKSRDNEDENDDQDDEHSDPSLPSPPVITMPLLMVPNNNTDSPQPSPPQPQPQQQQQQQQRRNNPKRNHNHKRRRNHRTTATTTATTLSLMNDPRTEDDGVHHTKSSSSPSPSTSSFHHYYKSSLFLFPPDGKEKDMALTSSSTFSSFRLSHWCHHYCGCHHDKTSVVMKNTLTVMNVVAKLVIWTSVAVLAAAVIWYSYELKTKGTDPHLIAWFSAGAFVLLGFPISMVGIVGHLANYNQPHVQCYVVRILWMVPIYSMESWLCLRFHKYAIYIETLRDCYESYVLYSFLQFLIQTLGGEEALILMLKDKSPTRGVHMWGLQYCVKPWLMGQPVSKSMVPYHPHHHHNNNNNMATSATTTNLSSSSTSTATTATTTTTTSGGHSPKLASETTFNNNNNMNAPVVIKRVQWTSPFFVKCKFGVLQYVLLKFVSSVFVMILELKGWYKEGDFTYKSGYLYICFLTNASQCWALYCLIFFYYATHNELSPIRPVGKFLSVKALVFFTWWQSVFISILYQMDLIQHYHTSGSSGGGSSSSGGGAGGGFSSTLTNTSDMEWTSEDVAKGLQDYLICIEMFLAAIVHTFCFPHSEYSIPAVQARARALQQQQQQQQYHPHVGKSSSGGSSGGQYYHTQYYHDDHNSNSSGNGGGGHHHTSGSYHKRLGRKQYLYPTTATAAVTTTYSPPRSLYARNRRTDRLRMATTTTSQHHRTNYSWSDNHNVMDHNEDDDNDTLAVSSKTSDQYHPDDHDVEMASRSSMMMMMTPTPSLEDDDFEHHGNGSVNPAHSLPPSLPLLKPGQSNTTHPTVTAATSASTTGVSHHRRSKSLDHDESMDHSFVNVNLQGDDDAVDGRNAEDQGDEEDYDDDEEDDTNGEYDDDEEEEGGEEDLTRQNSSYTSHRPPPLQPPPERPNFVRALWDSAIPRDLGENTVGIVKGDYVVEKKTLLHHAATSDNYDLFSHSRVLRVHPKTAAIHNTTNTTNDNSNSSTRGGRRRRLLGSGGDSPELLLSTTTTSSNGDNANTIG
jgi:hypothetical protein